MYIYYIYEFSIYISSIQDFFFSFPFLLLGNKWSPRIVLCTILAFMTFASASDLQNLSTASSNFVPDQYLSRIASRKPSLLLQWFGEEYGKGEVKLQWQIIKYKNTVIP